MTFAIKARESELLREGRDERRHVARVVVIRSAELFAEQAFFDPNTHQGASEVNPAPRIRPTQWPQARLAVISMPNMPV